MTPLGSREKLLVGALVILVVVVVVLAVFAFVPRSPKYSAVLNIHIDYYGIGKGETINFTVFVNGHHRTDGSLTGTRDFPLIEDTDLSIVVRWSGHETHQCLVEVFCEEKRYATSVWVANGLESSIRFIIRG